MEMQSAFSKEYTRNSGNSCCQVDAVPRETKKSWFKIHPVASHSPDANDIDFATMLVATV